MPIQWEMRVLSLAAALQRISDAVKSVGTVIDVGASDGRWSKTVMRFYPNAHFLLVEPNAFHERALRVFEKLHVNTSVCRAVAGDSCGSIFFDDRHPFGGRASKVQDAKFFKPYPSVTIDSEVAARKLPSPYLLKLDTHGFEIPILEGAKDVISRASVVVLEVYNTTVPGAPPFYEVCRLMYERGFVCSDLSDVAWNDGTLWQLDMYFIRRKG